ncbi:lipopolysaccharide biosynthesis protein [Allochromatium vinosum]|uniref:lipopolysaccharide biosynthesis protein n=1 Tax=Allochromatium vinosum TaxID=1049 RepID=UPI00190346B6|nr:lipopolysaccharide biosynthesis protein [Allochromatium vinosum]MBK1656553.1 hypothetical protein [Allochromatium vinosum]
MTSVRRALALSIAERYLLIALALVSNILLARMLTPEEIGIYSVSLAVIGIAHVLRDFGIGNFLIQEKHLTEAHIRTALGISLLIGGTLFAMAYIAAPFVAGFYGEVQMQQTLQISSLNFLTLPFCTISLALLRREMAFKRLLWVNLLAASTGFLVTIGLAYYGFGPNSMAIGAVVLNIVTGVGAWRARSDRKLLLPGFSMWRPVMNFGGQNVAAGVVTTIAMDINDLAVGKILGMAPVAMISRAQGLMNLFHRDVMGAISNVAYPAFANTFRQQGDLESQYIFSVASITAIAWPFYAFASLFSLELIRLLFGHQWDDAAPLVPLFCLGGAIGATFSLIIPLLIAQGEIKRATMINIIVQPLRAGVTVACVWYFQSMEAFAVTFLIVAFLACPYFYYVKSKIQRNDFRLLLPALKKSAILTLLCSVFPVLIFFMAPRNDSGVALIFLIVAVVLCAIIWAYGIILLKHPLSTDPIFTKLLQLLLGFFKTKQPPAKAGEFAPGAED